MQRALLRVSYAISNIAGRRQTHKYATPGASEREPAGRIRILNDTKSKAIHQLWKDRVKHVEMATPLAAE